MSTHRLINWTIAAGIAALMSTAYLLDGPDDIATAKAVADDLASITRVNTYSHDAKTK